MRLLILILLPIITFSQNKIKDSINLYYQTNDYVLTQKQKDSLYSFLRSTNTAYNDSIIVISSTDFIGKRHYNLLLSKRRSQYIGNYLDSLAFKNVTQIFLGEIFNNSKVSTRKGIQEHRKSTVIKTFYNLKEYTYLNALDTLKKGDHFFLNNTSFLTKTATLTQQSKPELDSLAAILLKNLNLKINIEIPASSTNKTNITNKETIENEALLSYKRAKKIYDYLLSKGIDTIRLNYGVSTKTSELKKSKIDKQLAKQVKVIVYSNNYLERLNDITIGESITLKNIFFEWGKAKPTPESFPQILNLFNVLTDYPNLKIEIQGHVCCGRKEQARGEKKSYHNIDLSNRRALVIKTKLIQLGIDANRIKHKGYGFSKPKIFPEKKSIDKETNRRIEILLLEK